MNDTAKILNEFIDAAERGRKYPKNTAMALRTALKVFEPELRDEERASVEAFSSNLALIYQEVFNKNKTKFSVGSLDTYRKRILRLLRDYQNYGTDPSKMNGWNPVVRHSPSLSRKKMTPNRLESPDLLKEKQPDERVTRLELPLSNGKKALFVLPPANELGEDDIALIKSYLNVFVGVGDGSSEKSPKA